MSVPRGDSTCSEGLPNTGGGRASSGAGRRLLEADESAARGDLHGLSAAGDSQLLEEMAEVRRFVANSRGVSCTRVTSSARLAAAAGAR